MKMRLGVSTAVAKPNHRGTSLVTFALLSLMAGTWMLRQFPSRNALAMFENTASSTMTNTNNTTRVMPFQSFTRVCGKVEVEESNLKSQSSEDEALLTWFNGLCNGTYLEIGGLDGIRYSNTYVFNKELDWRGVLIELSSSNYDRLVVNRPNELATIHAGVCDRKRLLHYVEGKQAVGGIWEFAPDTFKERFWRGITLESPQVRPVECAPLADLLEPHLGPSYYFDFFSLDVEGAEFEVLKSIDFTKLGFGIIFAESDSHNQLKNMALRMFLEGNGYKFVMDYERSYWFVNENFAEIYRDRLYMDTAAQN